MVLKIKLNIIFIVLVGSLFANLELKHTDKYDTNFYSDNSINNTKLFIGTNLLEFIEPKYLSICYNFIDSFLINEKIDFNKNIILKNNNTLEIDLLNAGQSNCKQLSFNWHKNFNIEWLRLLNSLIEEKNYKYNSSKLILDELYKNEKYRPFNSSNIINSTLLAFVLPNYIPSKVITNTKRFSPENAEIDFIQVIENDSLEPEYIKSVFPSCNKKSFLKNCISLYAFENSLINNSMVINYHISQIIVENKSILDTKDVNNFKPDFKALNNHYSEEEFNSIRISAINSIFNSLNYNNLFFYSYSDIKLLERIKNNTYYTIESYEIELENFKNISKYIIEIPIYDEENFLTNVLEPVCIDDFHKELQFKANSIEFENIEDSTLINKLYLFLELNKNYNLAITAYSKKNEYIFIEKDKKESILSRYIESGYIISKSKKLKLYRSLYIFQKLVNKGINPERINCFGLSGKDAIAKFEFFKIS